ncbi:MAG TPA: hypothetical protein DD381_04225 [Lentisphaeria bacterium]|nr:MAG: hypothetical protein A2X47_06405 [Lentisphaerae bacterium GWF2_38_69]HBM15538.1 hypothetical protein [Lentisphaeria bacterium]
MYDSEEKGTKYYTNIFIAICIIWFLIWSFLPFFLFEGIFCDITEYVALTNQQFFWGHDKQPYFGMWLIKTTAWFGDLKAGYFLSQICVLICSIAIWKLARACLSEALSLISVIFFLITPTYTCFSLDFCQNVQLQALWLLIILYFYKSLISQKYSDWILLGLFCGLGLMTKYFTAFLFVPMALFTLFTNEGRASFSKAGIYLCAILFLVIILPNFIWLVNNDFISFTYGIDEARLENIPPFLNHFTSPLRVIGLILINFLFSIIMLFTLLRKRDSKSYSYVPNIYKKYVISMTLFPLILIILFTGVEGSYIKMEWLYPTVGMFGIFAMIFWRPDITKQKVNKCLIYSGYATFFGILVTLYAVMYYFPYKYSSMAVIPYPSPAISKDITKVWYDSYPAPVKYVIGPYRFASMIAVCDPNHPETIYMNWDYRNRYPLYKSAVEEEGAILIWKGSERPEWFEKLNGATITKYQTRNYFRAVKPWFEELIKSWSGETPKTQDVSFAFIPPRNKN